MYKYITPVFKYKSDIKSLGYLNNALGDVYKHYDPKTGKNVITPNVLPSKNKEGKDGKS